MGGTTIAVYGDTEKDVLEKLTQQIEIGRVHGLYPDSEAVIISGDDLISNEVEKTKAKLFTFSEEGGEYIEVEKGRTFHVGVAARFHKAPEPGQLLGTIHLHT